MRHEGAKPPKNYVALICVSLGNLNVLVFLKDPRNEASILDSGWRNVRPSRAKGQPMAVVSTGGWTRLSDGRLDLVLEFPFSQGD
jgi:hypothetical protein